MALITRARTKRKPVAEMNVVPYIDVMLVLLIIFMVAAPITNPSVINLPTAGKSTQPPADYIEIALKPNTQATIRINGPKSGGKKAETVTGKVDLAERLQALHADNPDLAVMISADKEIKYDEVVQVISEVKKQGIARVGLATK